MPNFERLAICPFYEREAAMSVTCEGMECRVHTAVKFESCEDKRKWFARYCATYAYGRCPYAEMITEGKYGEEEGGIDPSENRQAPRFRQKQ